MQMGYTIDFERGEETLMMMKTFAGAKSNASHSTPRVLAFTITREGSSAGSSALPLFIWNENRSKHILSHILSQLALFIVRCFLSSRFERVAVAVREASTRERKKMWNMNFEIANKMESSYTR
jgi:hypothetical protein